MVFSGIFFFFRTQSRATGSGSRTVYTSGHCRCSRCGIDPRGCSRGCCSSSRCLMCCGCCIHATIFLPAHRIFIGLSGHSRPLDLRLWLGLHMMLVRIMVLHHVCGHRHGHGAEGRGRRRHFNSLCSLWSSIRVQPGYKGVVLRGRGRRKGHYDLCWPPKKEPGVEPGGGGIARGSQRSLRK